METIKRLIKNIRRITGYMGRRHISMLAAACSFWFFLSMVPTVMLTVSILPYTSVTEGQMLELVSAVAPESLQQLVNTIIADIYASHRSAMSLSLIATAWSASMGFSALIRGLEQVYDQPHYTNFILRRFRGMFYMIALLASIVFAIVLMGLGYVIMDSLEVYLPFLSDLFSFLMHFRFLFAVLALTAVFAVIYRWAPGLPLTFKSQIPGALFAATSWAVFSWLFSTWVRLTNSYGAYGSLSTVVAVMLWMYYCMYILLWGGFLNLAIQRSKRIPRFSFLMTDTPKPEERKNTE